MEGSIKRAPEEGVTQPVDQGVAEGSVQQTEDEVDNVRQLSPHAREALGHFADVSTRAFFSESGGADLGALMVNPGTVPPSLNH